MEIFDIKRKGSLVPCVFRRSDTQQSYFFVAWNVGGIISPQCLRHENQRLDKIHPCIFCLFVLFTYFGMSRATIERINIQGSPTLLCWEASCFNHATGNEVHISSTTSPSSSLICENADETVAMPAEKTMLR